MKSGDIMLFKLYPVSTALTPVMLVRQNDESSAYVWLVLGLAPGPLGLPLGTMPQTEFLVLADELVPYSNFKEKLKRLL